MSTLLTTTAPNITTTTTTTTINLKDELFQLVQNGNLNEFRRLLTNDLMYAKDRHGHTLLYNACVHNHVHIIKYLMQECNYDSSTSSVTSILVNLLQKDNYDLFKYLIKHEKFNCRGKNQSTLLHDCVHKQQSELVELLIEQGADPNLLNSSHATSLTVAIQVNNYTLCKYLLDSGACVNVQDRKGNTPMHVACMLCVQMKDTRILELLLTMCTSNLSTSEDLEQQDDYTLRLKNQQDETVLDCLWSNIIKEHEFKYIYLIDKFIQQGALFSIPWNVAFNTYSQHFCFIKCIACICKYKLVNLFSECVSTCGGDNGSVGGGGGSSEQMNLIINCYWTNSLIIAIKSLILTSYTEAIKESVQREMYEAICIILASNQFRKLNLKEILSTFYMFDNDLNDLFIYGKLVDLMHMNMPMKLSYLCRIKIRESLSTLDNLHINRLKLSDHLRKFLMFIND